MITPKNATQPDEWQKINPQLSITDPQNGCVDIATAGALSDGFDASQLSERFWDEGYFLIEDILPTDALATLREGIETLVRHDLPPAMIYLYDEAWQIFMRLTRVRMGVGGHHIAIIRAKARLAMTW